MASRGDATGGTQLNERVNLVREITAEDLASSIDYKKILRGTLRRIWIIVLFAILFTIGFAYLAHVLSSRYVASTYLMFEEETTKSLPGGIPLGQFSKASVVDMITLPSHLNAVKSILGLELTEKEMLKMISVQPPTYESNLINLSVTADNPSLAIDIANTLASVVVKSAKDYSKRQLSSIYDYYKGQAESLRQKLGDQIKEISEFQRQHPGFDITSQGSISARSSLDLEARRQSAIEQYNGLLIQYENLRREAARIPDNIVREAAARDSLLQQRLAQSQMGLLEAQSRYAPENPKIKSLEAEVAGLQKAVVEENAQQTAAAASTDDTNPALLQRFEKNPLKEQFNLQLLDLRGKLRSAQKLREDLEDLIKEKSKQLEGLPEDQQALSRLLMRKLQLEQELNQTEATLKGAEAMLSIGKSGLDIYLAADKAQPAESWFIKLLPLIGFLLGSGFGYFVALLTEMSDRKIRTTRQVELTYTPPCVVTIPQLGYLSKRTGERQMQYFIRVLDEAFEKATGRHIPLVLAITSSVSNEGKSTLAYFLAKYQEKLGRRVIVIDFDKHPSSYLGNSPDVAVKGVEQFLRGEATLEELIMHDSPDRIGTNEDPNMKELVKSAKMNELLDQLRGSYDLIILDVPGIIEEHFSSNVAAAADATLFVIGSSQVNKSVINTSLHELEIQHVVPFGIALNRVLSVYIDDVRIRSEAKKARVGLLERLAFRTKRN